jgi:hypothetical protein
VSQGEGVSNETHIKQCMQAQFTNNFRGRNGVCFRVDIYQTRRGRLFSDSKDG